MEMIDTISEWVLDNLPFNKTNPDIFSSISSKSPQELLVIYHNWRNRVPLSQPRKLIFSDEFEFDLINYKSEHVIDQIINNIKKAMI